MRYSAVRGVAVVVLIDVALAHRRARSLLQDRTDRIAENRRLEPTISGRELRWNINLSGVVQFRASAGGDATDSTSKRGRFTLGYVKSRTRCEGRNSEEGS